MRFQRVVVFAFGIEHPGGRDLPLNIDLLRPIGVIGFAQLVMQLSELGDVCLGSFHIAGAGSAESAREMRHRPNEANALGELAARLPPSSLRVRPYSARRHQPRARIRARDGRLVKFGHSLHLIHNVTRLLVLRELQMA